MVLPNRLYCTIASTCISISASTKQNVLRFQRFVLTSRELGHGLIVIYQYSFNWWEYISYTNKEFHTKLWNLGLDFQSDTEYLPVSQQHAINIMLCMYMFMEMIPTESSTQPPEHPKKANKLIRQRDGCSTKSIWPMEQKLYSTARNGDGTAFLY